MDYISSTLYGLIQGLSEFLPVSSSGHLALLPHFLEIKDPGVFFDLTMHVGTGFAVGLYFRREVMAMLSAFIQFFIFRKKHPSHFLMMNSLIATVSSLIVIVALLKFNLNDLTRTPKWIASNLIIFGILMFFIDKFCMRTKKNFEGSSHPKEAIFIGLLQAMAIFPGVSRSGITLTGARGLGLNRHNSTRFSFLLSLPIIFGGFVLKLPEAIQSSNLFSLEHCLIGGLVSFAFGLISIHYFLKFIERIGLGPFALYRVVIGVIILLVV
jgi:undecaprenyl-diphosphatase